MVNSKNKGGNFEREICKILSLWWTEDERDDIFWRTSNSGGRATIRSRKNINSTTFGQYGDIQATDPIGQPLINACTIELKKGYKKWNFLEVLDGKGDNYALLEFLRQVIIDRKKSGARWEIIIAKRDGRLPIIIFPKELAKMLDKYCGSLNCEEDEIKMAISFGLREFNRNGPYTAMIFTDFLYWCDPEFFKTGEWKKGLVTKIKRTRG